MISDRNNNKKCKRVKVEVGAQVGFTKRTLAFRFFFFHLPSFFTLLSFSVSSFDLTHFSRQRQACMWPPREQIREGQLNTTDR